MRVYGPSQTISQSNSRRATVHKAGNLALGRSVDTGGFPGASSSLPFNVLFNFATQTYSAASIGAGTFATFMTCSRNSIKYVQWADGHFSQIAANTPAISDWGLLSEQASTNQVLQSRDFTQAAWVKTTMTAAKNQTGIDLGVNAASSLTATGANATVFQARTIASSATAGGFYIKRLIGTGTISISIDGGSTYVDITSQLATTQYVLVQTTQTLANPSLGIKIGVNGDSIAVDGAQLESFKKLSSPIFTTAGTANRLTDVIRIADPLLTIMQTARSHTLFLENGNQQNIPSGAVFYNLVDSLGTSLIRCAGDTANGGNYATLTNANGHNASLTFNTGQQANETQRSAFAVAVGDQAFCASQQPGSLANSIYINPVITATADTVPNLLGGTITIGGTTSGGSQAQNYIRQFAWMPSRASNSQLQSWCSGTLIAYNDNTTFLGSTLVNGAAAAALPIMGAGITLFQNHDSTLPVPVATNVAMFNGINGKIVRDGRPWASIESAAGVYDFTVQNNDATLNAIKAAGGTVCFNISLTNALYGSGPPTTSPQITAYTNYAVAAVNHYGTSQMMYELGNEQNLAANWNGSPSVSQYITLINTCAAAMRAAVPSCIIVTGGMGNQGQSAPNDPNTYGAAMVAGMSPIGNFSGVGMHPYATNLALSGPEGLIAIMSSLSAAIGNALPLYSTEQGYSQDQVGFSQRRRGVYAARSALSFLINRPAMTAWFEMCNETADPIDHESNFGLYDVNFQALPAALGYGTILGLRNNCATYDILQYPAWVYQINFHQNDGSLARVVWNYHMPPMNMTQSIDVGAPTTLSVSDCFGAPVSFNKVGTVVTFLMTESTGPVVVTTT